ncbi:MAG: alpha-mannosidase, partial [Gemmatimonadota bacterium]
EYPSAELGEATRALLRNQFHDILPGTSTPSVEQSALDDIGHGLTLVARAKTRAFFALAAGQKVSREGEHPILVYNPHPFPLHASVECEMQPAWPDREHMYGVPTVTAGGRKLEAQAEQQESNINEDHRHRVVFAAKLEPGRMNRFDCRFEKIACKPTPKLKQRNGAFRFKTAELEVIVNARTGLLDRYRVGGEDYLSAGAFRSLVIHDDADPWGQTVTSFRNLAGRFKLMSQTAAARFAGVSAARLPGVRVIEDGPVRAVVEALFEYGDSAICQRYKLPRTGTELEIETRVLWGEKDRMLKLALPTPWHDGKPLGQVAYCVQELRADGDECVAQKWLAVLSHERSRALSIINDSTYGCDFKNGELRLSLLRAPAHAGHPTFTERPLVQQDRFVPRIDQGEHVFRFWLNGGGESERLTAVDREALAHNERPYALAYWPPGGGEVPKAGPALRDRAVQITAFKRAEEGGDLIVRLFEPTGHRRKTTLSLDCAAAKTPVQMEPFEIKTLRLDRQTQEFSEVDLLEE